MSTRFFKLLSTGSMIIVMVMLSGAPLAAAKAEVYNNKVIYQVDYYLGSYCDGQTEIVHVVGYIQWVSHTTIDDQGGAHIQYHGYSKLKGVGEESGLKYESIWNENSSRILTGPGPWEFTDTYYFRFVAEGTGRVFFFKETWVTTISTNGEWSSYRSDLSSYCNEEAP